MYNTYAYKMDDVFDLTGIRQFVKLCHVYSCLEHIDNPKILDVGCGWGEVKEFLDKNSYRCNYVSLDITNNRFKDNNFVCFDLTRGESLPFANSEFDVVLMLDSLQNIEIESGKRAISEISRVLKQGGVVCISTRNSLMKADEDSEHHLVRWNILELLATIKENFLYVSRVYGVNYGYNEKEVISDNGGNPLVDFLPDRFFRVLCGVYDWKKCKCVMVDCIK